MAPARAERPRQERAELTRAALLDAALECLVEKGYAATTTIETARRAGVSRGAQLHHFPTKAELLTAVVDRLKERRIEEFRKAVAQAAPEGDRVQVAIDVMWSMYQGPTFVAWAELWVAARTDAELARALIESDQRFAAAATEAYSEVVPPAPGEDLDQYRMAPEFAFALMDGLAFQRLVPRDDMRPAADFIDVLKAIAALVMGPHPPNDDHQEERSGS